MCKSATVVGIRGGYGHVLLWTSGMMVFHEQKFTGSIGCFKNIALLLSSELLEFILN